MNQSTKKPKIGYVVAILSQAARESLGSWVRATIPDEALFTTEINGVLEGGNVAQKSHLTLFFGINGDVVDRRTVEGLLNSIIVPDLKVKGIDSFKIPNVPCKILHLTIDDSDGQLRAVHDLFSTLPHLEDKQEPDYVPHITLAYVKNSFNEHLIKYNGLNKLKVQEIAYKIKA